MAAKDFPKSFREPLYAAADAGVEKKLDLPAGMLSSIRVDGERTNADRVSSAGARTPYQIIPATRNAILEQYGIDAYLSPETASEAAGLLLRDSLKRNQGDPETAVREYHGGTNPANWGKINDAYWQRVSGGMRDSTVKALSEGFGKWMADNPTQPAAPSAPAAADPVGAKLSQGFGAWLAGQGQIPGTPTPERDPVSTIPQPRAPDAPGLIDHALGTGEAVAALGSQGILGGLGMAGGFVGGVADRLSNAFTDPGTMEKATAAGMHAGASMGYQPRTQSGQDQALAGRQFLGDVVLPAAAALPGLGPAAMAFGGALRAARPAAAAVLDKAATAMPQAMRDLPGRVMDAARPGGQAPTAGTMGSAGAAGADMAAQRVMRANSLPVPIGDQLTKGMATRDPAQLKFEAETAKNPEQGAPLRQRTVELNQKMMENMDTMFDLTGAQSRGLQAVGGVVDDALVKQFKRDKTEVNYRFGIARRSEEAQAAVNPNLAVSIGEGEQALTASPIDYLNSKLTGLQTTSLTDHARQYAIKIGIAEDAGGSLVGLPATVGKMEHWRSEINQATGFESYAIRDATILKKLIDAQTAPVAGPLFRQARAARERLAQNYEDHAVISKLVENKRGTADRQVAFEDIFDHAILRGGLDDVRTVQRVLMRSGAEGKQAWRELQGATVDWIQSQSFEKNIATDGAGRRVLSPSKLDAAIRQLDRGGKLDRIFGKKNAETMRDLRDAAIDIKTVPPESAVNHSNAVATLAAFADVAFSIMSGVPAPITTVSRMAINSIKDRKLRARIQEALKSQDDNKSD